jgi:hypothetical protein
VWKSGRAGDDDLVGTALGLPTWAACVAVVLLMVAGCWVLQRPLPRANRAYFVDLIPRAGAWDIQPIPTGAGLPALSAGAVRVRIDLREFAANRRGPAFAHGHAAKVSLDSFSPPASRDQALDVLQSRWAAIAGAAGAQWPGHALERAVVARGSPVYTVWWPGVGQAAVLMIGLAGLLVVRGMGQESAGRDR